jgi:hypothetical protein
VFQQLDPLTGRLAACGSSLWAHNLDLPSRQQDAIQPAFCPSQAFARYGEGEGRPSCNCDVVANVGLLGAQRDTERETRHPVMLHPSHRFTEREAGPRGSTGSSSAVQQQRVLACWGRNRWPMARLNERLLQESQGLMCDVCLLCVMCSLVVMWKTLTPHHAR